ncbi:MAG: hypothetical protein KIS92_11470 [Planctomycetota bacterium]|nr:hypothetical protein [Planctomycetota bacterium]
MHIDCDFPGGNVIVDQIEGDTAHIRPDVRDTMGHWFYWHFRVAGAAGRTVRFQFPGGDGTGPRGPCVSTDGGKTWAFYGRECVQEKSFTYAFPSHAHEVRFCVGIPYTERNLHEFLPKHRGRPLFSEETLCADRSGRAVELLKLGKPAEDAAACLLLTARHHCCETTPSFAAEGFIDAYFGEDALGGWLREKLACWIVPFVDKDGVEAGDQGKNRAPHDHNRDYLGQPGLYPTVGAIREQVPAWGGEKLRVVMDLHCPWIRGKWHEDIYFVGCNDAEHWARTSEYCRRLEEVRAGPLPYYTAHNLPYGTDWNVDKEPHLSSCAKWARTLPSVWLANSVEIPYAACSGVEITPGRARLFGRDLAAALKAYLEPRL